MGIDRHEWEHRNYKSGRTAAVPAPLADDESGQLAVDASLGEAPPQPETPKAKAKAAPKESAKDKSKESSKAPSKTNAKAPSGGKRSGRAG